MYADAPAFEAHALSKTYGWSWALRDVTFSVARGEIVCLLGPNGAGKTTIVNVFLGFVAPTAGAARVCGVAIGHNGDATSRRIAYIPEQLNLYPHFTGLENLRFFLAAAASADFRDASLLRALADAGLAREAAQRPVATYSKGMRQKVGIALALTRKADAVLLDEPTSGLDPAAAAEFSESLTRLRDRGAGILMVTHDLFRARDVASRLGIMSRGRLIDLFDAAAVTPEEVERRYLEAVRDEALHKDRVSYDERKEQA
jgi:ABC-2 type transport system ATP-binding protein